MNGIKPWYKSKAIIGSLVATFCLLLAAFGVGVTEDEQGRIVDQTILIVEVVGALLGTALSIYGRLKAEKKIGSPSWLLD